MIFTFENPKMKSDLYFVKQFFCLFVFPLEILYLMVAVSELSRDINFPFFFAEISNTLQNDWSIFGNLTLQRH